MSFAYLIICLRKYIKRRTAAKLANCDTGVGVTVTGVRVTVTGVSVTVTGVSVTVTGVSVTVTGVSVTVTGVSVTVTGVSVTATGVSVTVTGVNVTVTGVSVTVTGVSVTVIGVSVTVTVCVVSCIPTARCHSVGWPVGGTDVLNGFTIFYCGRNPIALLLVCNPRLVGAVCVNTPTLHCAVATRSNNYVLAS